MDGFLKADKQAAYLAENFINGNKKDCIRGITGSELDSEGAWIAYLAIQIYLQLDTTDQQALIKMLGNRIALPSDQEE